jgi:hypothetical protein
VSLLTKFLAPTAAGQVQLRSRIASPGRIRNDCRRSSGPRENSVARSEQCYRFAYIEPKASLRVCMPTQSRYFPLMTIPGTGTWSRRHAMAHVVALCLVVQSLFAGLHAARFIDQQLVASDPSICHGGNTAPNSPGSDHPDTCCLLGCTGAGQIANLPRPTTLPLIRAVGPTSTHPIGQLGVLRSHLGDGAHNRPRSPPSA